MSRMRLPGIARAFFLCLLGALCAGRVQAGPIPPSPSPVPSAGESLLTSSFIAGNAVNIDWEVIPVSGTAFGQGTYAYLYQIENTSTSGVDIFSVSLPSAVSFNSIVAIGSLANDSLDTLTAFHPAHNASTFPILATEFEPAATQNLTNVNANLNAGDDTATWSFNPLAQGFQSTTLYFLSTQPPVYGLATLQDHIPPSPWTSLGPNAQQVPVPVPEPTSVVLLGLGVLGLVGVRRLQK
jgi:hypothetical protein